MTSIALLIATACAEHQEPDDSMLLQLNKIRKSSETKDTFVASRHQPGRSFRNGCVDSKGLLFKGVMEDCTNKDFHVFKGTVAEMHGDLIEPTYRATTYGSDSHWETMPVQEGDWDASCVAYVHTNGGNCKTFCEDQGLTCQKAMDDSEHQKTGPSSWLQKAGYDETICTLHPLSSARQTADENGCLQNWNTQICACAAPRTTPEPPRSGCVSDSGVVFKGMMEDCTNKDFHVFKGTMPEMHGDLITPTYNAATYGSDSHWKTIPFQEGGWDATCVAYVMTRGGNCKDWCEDQGLTCQKAMDDSEHQKTAPTPWLKEETYCTLHPISSARQTADENGCLQNWNSQICACAAPRPPTVPEPPLGCVDSENVVFGDVVEDCTNHDFFEFKGEVRELVDPTFDPNTYGADDKWRTFPVQAGGAWDSKRRIFQKGALQASCVAYVKTEGATCKTWCESHGMTCVKAMDDAHHQVHHLNSWLTAGKHSETMCTVSPRSSDRQTADEDGCLQTWKTQICACN